MAQLKGVNVCLILTFASEWWAYFTSSFIDVDKNMVSISLNK